VWAGAAFLPVSAYLALWAIVRLRNRSPQEKKLGKARRAFGALKRRLAALRPGDPRLCEEVLGSVREYLQDRLALEAAVVTCEDAEPALRARGATPEQSNRLREIFARCEAGCYGGSAPEELARLPEDAMALAREWERSLV
jgi:hypothetical protein